MAEFAPPTYSQATDYGVQPTAPPLEKKGQPEIPEPPPAYTAPVPIAATQQNDEPERKMAWRQSLLGCLDDIGICALTYLCGCITLFLVGKRTNHLNYAIGALFLLFVILVLEVWYHVWNAVTMPAASPYKTGNDYDYNNVDPHYVMPADTQTRNLGLILTALTVFGVWCLRVATLAKMRKVIRNDNNIGGTTLEDCAVAACCENCMLCQMMAETNERPDPINNATQHESVAVNGGITRA